MADRKLAKWQIASLAIIILIIPVIIVFQLTKADIVINFDDDDPFKNKCFLGQTECIYMHELGVNVGGEVEFRDDMDLNRWLIIGEDVFCIKIERTVAEPVADPVGVITEETEISCNNIAVFDKDEWDLKIGIAIPDEEGNLVDLFIGFSSIPPPPEGSQQTFTFTMIGT